MRTVRHGGNIYGVNDRIGVIESAYCDGCLMTLRRSND
jgi:hypothetical protein